MSDPSLSPDETIRSDAAAATSREPKLPSISVDLREAGPISGTLRTDLEVRGVIGEGGMGRVLLVRQHSLSRDVAVKTVKPTASDAARAAILSEGAVTGQLEHPSIVPVHALGLDASGWPVMVMKRVEGVSWDVLLANPAHAGWEGWEGSPQNRLAGHLQILMSVANALHFAHSRRIVHRDVKPANVLIGGFGDVYLADWGVASDLGSSSQQVCGTPGYLAPEMVLGGVIDARTDVFLLGATLHQVLTGALRHPGPSVDESLAHAQTSPPFTYAPEVPAELAALANQACHFEPKQRPESARAFRDALQLYVRHQDAVALGVRAQAKLAELETLLAVAQPGADDDARIERLSAEARFGLEQSLALFGDNAPARAALGRVDGILEQRRRRAAELEAESRERDPRRGAGARTFGLGLMTGFIGIVACIATWIGEPSLSQLIALPSTVTVALLVGGLLMRGRMLASRFNRQVFAAVFTTMGCVLIGRVTGLVAGIPVPVQFARDGMVMAGGMAVIALGWLRWAGFISGIFALAGVLCSLFPHAATRIFSWSSFAALLIATVVSWRHARELAKS